MHVRFYRIKSGINGSGHILHSIYWTIMAPLGMGGQPGPHTIHQIKRRLLLAMNGKVPLILTNGCV